MILNRRQWGTGENMERFSLNLFDNMQSPEGDGKPTVTAAIAGGRGTESIFLGCTITGWLTR